MRYAKDMSAPSRTGLRSASLAAELRVALLHTSRRLRVERSSDDITPGQFTVLSVLDRHGPLTPREIAEHEKVRPPSMTRTLAALEVLGLVTRTDHPTDGRQVILSLTPEGQRAVGRIRRHRDEWMLSRFEHLTDEERDLLRRTAGVLAKVASE